MILRFYKITDAPEVVNKTLGEFLEVEGTCRSELDTFSPEVVVGFDCRDYNYMYIPEFDRYYFINGGSFVSNGLFRVKDVREDVLMSLKDELQNLMVIIDKTEMPGVGNEYINDGSFITSSKTINKVYDFPDGFNDNPDFILLTAGGWLGGA